MCDQPGTSRHMRCLLLTALQELVINPVHQELDPLHWVLAWQDVMPLNQVGAGLLTCCLLACLPSRSVGGRTHAAERFPCSWMGP